MPRHVNGTRRPGADRLPPPLRRRPSGGPRAPWPAASSAGCTPCGRPPWTRRPPPRGVHRRLRRHLPRLQRARLRHRPLGDRPRGRRGLRHRRATAAPTSSPSSATSTPPPTLLTFDDGTIAVVSNTRYNAARLRRPPRAARHRRTASPSAWRTAPPLRNRSNPASTCPGRAARHVLHGPVRRRLPRRAHRLHRGRRRAADPRRARSTTRWRSAWIAEAATLSLQQHRPVRIDEVRHDHHRHRRRTPRPDRRRPHLLGGLRGARLGLPARPRPGARRDARRRAVRHRARPGRVPARRTRRRWPTCSTPTT